MSNEVARDAIRAWHELVESRNIADLDALLAESAVFHSPIVHTPQEGKALTKLYLAGAFGIFSDSDFHYEREVVTGNDAVLEFSAEVEGIRINGVDMIRFDDDGKIVDFKVMVRPLKAINLLHQKMAAMLKQLDSK